MPDRRVAVFLSHADPGALRLAGSCALAAASMGDRVDVYLFGQAVPAVVAAHDAEPDEPGALLHQARAAGACRLVACSASVVEEKVPLDAAEQALDAVVGWPTVIEWSRGVVDRFFF
ncbi:MULTISPECIES: DsrE family protein [unclassified Anaeromyxobacter]|uniref:DsrE family protein n=1 Tax=unclassified Anaeromyxobacter TaxID=2620896 RepID=UPI001F57F4D0|nr:MULTISPECIES: DsrE family protein [unclassified Anaeromyxobacter]